MTRRPHLVELAGPSVVLSELRGGGRPRPGADRAWCGGLREHLEDALSGLALPSSGDEPLRVGWRMLPPSPSPSPSGGVLPGRPMSAPGPALLDALVAVAFRQWVTCRLLTDPFDESLEAVRSTGDPDGVAEAVRRLGTADRHRLAAALAVQVARLAERWPGVDPRWAPVTNELLLAPLAGGRVVVGARTDLSLGPPAGRSASRCFVTAAARPPSPATWRRLWMAALVETVRAGVAPFQLSVLSTGAGALASVTVDQAGLWATAEALVAAVAAAAPSDAPAGPDRPVAGAGGAPRSPSRGATDAAVPADGIRVGAGARPAAAATAVRTGPAPRRRRPATPPNPLPPVRVAS